MDNISLVLVIIGLLLLAGYAAHAVGTRTHVPRVTLLLLLGLISGPYLLDLIPKSIEEWFPYIAHMALAMVGFLLGESFYGKHLKFTRRVVLWISIVQTVIVVFFVFIFLYISGAGIAISLLLAGIAPATDPAATVDLVQEGKAKGPLTDTLLGVVALDDAWGIILFSIILALVGVLVNGSMVEMNFLHGLWEVVGAGLLGVILGVPMAWLTGRIREGEPTLLEAAGFVFLCGGLALYLNVSFLLSSMVLGVVVANRAKHHTKPFRDIKGISEPFLALFFFLAGYKFELQGLYVIGGVTIAYIFIRFIGKVLGGLVGGKMSKAPELITHGIGWCLIPQAGVAVGMALLVVERFPSLGIKILPIAIASTIIFEIIGPILTLWQLRKAGELEQ
jgi:Kef-type K+ transport system membrane component KefB